MKKWTLEKSPYLQNWKKRKLESQIKVEEIKHNWFMDKAWAKQQLFTRDYSIFFFNKPHTITNHTSSTHHINPRRRVKIKALPEIKPAESPLKTDSVSWNNNNNKSQNMTNINSNSEMILKRKNKNNNNNIFASAGNNVLSSRRYKSNNWY